MNYLNQIREHLKEMQAGRIVPAQGVTHLLELFTLMKTGLEDLGVFSDTHYTADSLRTRVRFADGKMYSIEYREIRE